MTTIYKRDLIVGVVLYLFFKAEWMAMPSTLQNIFLWKVCIFLYLNPSHRQSIVRSGSTLSQSSRYFLQPSSHF